MQIYSVADGEIGGVRSRVDAAEARVEGLERLLPLAGLIRTALRVSPPPSHPPPLPPSPSMSLRRGLPMLRSTMAYTDIPGGGCGNTFYSCCRIQVPACVAP